jgi:hypothetical protein
LPAPPPPPVWNEPELLSPQLHAPNMKHHKMIFDWVLRNEEFVFSANGKGIFGEITRFENIKPSARKKFHRSKGRALVSMSSNFDNISKQFSASSITSNLLKEFTEQNVQYGKQNVGMQTPSLIHAFDDLILEFPCPLNKKVDFISSTLYTDLFLCENHD